jgi:tRNA nucleotidyltransferase/poly(A) polymerase
VTILGHGVLAEAHARVAGTINYELTSRLNSDPRRARGWSSMRELVEELFAGEEAWVVGGAVRDQALGRPVVDLDVALREPQQRRARLREALRRRAVPALGAPRAWRVALDGGRTVDFTPLPGSIEDDLASRDFGINAIAERVGQRRDRRPVRRPR